MLGLMPKWQNFRSEASRSLGSPYLSPSRSSVPILHLPPRSLLPATERASTSTTTSPNNLPLALHAQVVCIPRLPLLTRFLPGVWTIHPHPRLPSRAQISTRPQPAVRRKFLASSSRRRTTSRCLHLP